MWHARNVTVVIETSSLSWIGIATAGKVDGRNPTNTSWDGKHCTSFIGMFDFYHINVSSIENPYDIPLYWFG